MVNYVVVGGGVAGVCCAEELCRLCPSDSVTLVAVDRILKGLSTVAKITKTLEELEVVEKSLDALPYDNLKWVQGVAVGIDPQKKEILLDRQAPLPYDKICICTGARPRRLLNSPHVVVLRDTDSVAQLKEKLKHAKKAVVVGNGGIALELAHALHGMDVTWIVRHGHIGDAFFDLDAAQFVLEELQHSRNEMAVETIKKTSNSNAAPKTTAAPSPSPSEVTIEEDKRPLGHAVGPAWTRELPQGSGKGSFSVELRCEVTNISLNSSTTPLASPLPSSPCSETAAAGLLNVSLSDGRTIPTDVVISVIGVDPNVDWVPPEAVQSSTDKGLLVNQNMETSISGVYAAGDACSMEWAEQQSPHWFQMRLWSQARAQGVYAAHCMAQVQDQMGSDMAFEMFTHVTRFLGKKVVLLGLYNGQRLENEPEQDLVSYSRVTEGEERTFVRVLLLRGRVQGAVLIGETDLEETMENLILDGIDVSRYGPELLDPDVELDHIFD